MSAIVNAPILKLSARSLLGRGRVAVLIVLSVLMILLTLMLSQADVEDSAARGLITSFGFGVVAPVTVLVGTTTLFSSEFDDSSILYLLIKPISRLSIVTSKTMIILLASLTATVIPSVLAAAVLMDASRGVLAALAGAAIAAVGYTGVFTALSVVLKRSVLGCLGYWLGIELLLAGLLSPLRWISVNYWASDALAEISGVKQGYSPTVPTAFGLVAAVVALVLGIWVAGRRLRSITLSDD
ncbi:ABC transporter permease [Dermacoccaceae bacterium W4C1]